MKYTSCIFKVSSLRFTCISNLNGYVWHAKYLPTRQHFWKIVFMKFQYYSMMDKKLKRLRSYKDTYVHSLTLDCAKTGCLPCLYKINPAGLWRCGETDDYLQLKPNQRPEMCPRSNIIEYNGFILKNMKVLTVGDGDFSYSLSICSALKAKYAQNVVCTSYESQESVISTYQTSSTNIQGLLSIGSSVYHNIDATQLHEEVAKLPFQQYHRVIWNFPCIGAINGLDGQTSELEKNIELMTNFFRNVLPVLTSLPTHIDSGSSKCIYSAEVHITHKTIEPFSWWHIEDIAKTAGFALVGKVVFDRCLYPGYVNRKALDKKSFPLNDALIYIFQASHDAEASMMKHGRYRSATLENSSIIPVTNDSLASLDDILQQFSVETMHLPHTHTIADISYHNISNIQDDCSIGKKRKHKPI